MKLLSLDECDESILDALNSDKKTPLRSLEFIKKGRDSYISCSSQELPKVFHMLLCAYIEKFSVKDYLETDLASLAPPQTSLVKFVSACNDACDKQNTHLVKLTNINYKVSSSKTINAQLDADHSPYFHSGNLSKKAERECTYKSNDGELLLRQFYLNGKPVDFFEILFSEKRKEERRTLHQYFGKLRDSSLASFHTQIEHDRNLVAAHIKDEMLGDEDAFNDEVSKTMKKSSLPQEVYKAYHSVRKLVEAQVEQEFINLLSDDEVGSHPCSKMQDNVDKGNLSPGSIDLGSPQVEVLVDGERVSLTPVMSLEMTKVLDRKQSKEHSIRTGQVSHVFSNPTNAGSYMASTKGFAPSISNTIPRNNDKDALVVSIERNRTVLNLPSIRRDSKKAVNEFVRAMNIKNEHIATNTKKKIVRIWVANSLSTLSSIQSMGSIGSVLNITDDEAVLISGKPLECVDSLCSHLTSIFIHTANQSLSVSEGEVSILNADTKAGRLIIKLIKDELKEQLS